LISLVVLPLVLLGWVSAVAIQAEEARSRRAVENILRERLDDTVVQAAELLETIRLDLASQVVDPELVDGPPENATAIATQAIATQPMTRMDAAAQTTRAPAVIDPDNVAPRLARLRRRSATVKFVFWIDSGQRLAYPLIPDQIAPDQMDDYLGIDELMGVRPLGNSGGKNAASWGTPAWMPWYRQHGLQLVLWIPGPRGDVVGIVLNRSAWISQLIAGLPESMSIAEATGRSADRTDNAATRTRLVDAQGATVYQWGEGLQNAGDQTTWHELAGVPMSGPLSAWRVVYESDRPLPLVSGSTTALVATLVAVGLLLLALGLYVATGIRRQMRLATQQVSFAGLVSHELRTPLTNIRLYAEMAREDLVDQANSPQTQSVRRRLAVIEQETERLSTLCSSVLALVRQPAAIELQQHPPVDVAATIAGIVDQFRPALDKLGFEIVVEGDSVGALRIDRGALEMVLMNLLSNVEKYASGGRWLMISVKRGKVDLLVEVRDRGGGIPRRQRKRIFRPFVRLDDSINAPSGTGIGLSIARQAARRAGGDLVLVPRGEGACFQLRLPVG
jgi:signal transduction histidine kinase